MNSPAVEQITDLATWQQSCRLISIDPTALTIEAHIRNPQLLSFHPRRREGSDEENRNEVHELVLFDILVLNLSFTPKYELN